MTFKDKFEDSEDKKKFKLPVGKKEASLQKEGSFTFSFETAKESEKDLRLRAEALKSRIEAIAQKVVIKDVPIVLAIMNFTDNAEEIGDLGRALTRISEILPEYKEVSDKHSAVKATVDNPLWAQAMFADLSISVEGIINKSEK